MDKRTCPRCGNSKAHYADTCWQCYLAERRPRRVCTVDGCEAPHVAKGLCSFHRRLVRLGKPMDTPKRTSPGKSLRGKVPCVVDGCPALNFCRGYCMTHWNRVQRTGEPGPADRMRQPISNEWKTCPDGYVYKHFRGRGKLSQHRYVMEQILDRKLLPHENVHHLNGIRDDNRPENLELWSKSQPAGQRVTDKIAWAVEFLEQYGYTVLQPEQLRLIA